MRDQFRPTQKLETASSGFSPVCTRRGRRRSSPNHLRHSLAQLLHKEEGHTIIARRMAGFPLGPPLSMVWIRDRAWRVFPRPISSARMHPLMDAFFSPMVHWYMNATPSIWCGLSIFFNLAGSRTGCCVPFFHASPFSRMASLGSCAVVCFCMWPFLSASGLRKAGVRIFTGASFCWAWLAAHVSRNTLPLLYSASSTFSLTMDSQLPTVKVASGGMDLASLHLVCPIFFPFSSRSTHV
mmetsp:Transcript_9754/g.59246  ORF Transcript_9754/g.59246 Transcript_9754/m.59246 type:complete len:239 (-) Transcript_9754:303-1019(-)